MEISYSFHLGTRKHSVFNLQELKKVQKHNNRKFSSNKIDEKLIINIAGSDDIYKDVIDLYNNEFSSATENFNAKQKRTANKIESYIEKISQDKKQSVAEEIIITFGSKDFWEKKNFDQKEMTQVFEGQLNLFQKGYPNFVVANATIHYDEESPHMHIVGVPLRRDCTKGLETQVSKRTVFTKENLVNAQDHLRENMIKNLVSINITDENNNNISSTLELKEKQEGRNYNYSKKDITALNEEKKKLKRQKEKLDKKEEELNEKITEVNVISVNLKAVAVHKENELKQVTKERELLTAQRAKLDVENAEVLKKLKEDQEDKLKAERLKFEEELLYEQLEFYHKMILKQTDQIREINELSDGKLKITDEVLESVNNSYFGNVYDYFSVGGDLLDFNESVFANIENSDMTYEDASESITEYFETGFKLVQNLVTKGFKELMNFAKNISKTLKKEQKENELITERNKIQLEDITSNYQKNRDVKEFYESKLEQLDTLEAHILLEESKKIDIEPVINKHIEIIEEEIQEQIVSSEDISLFKEQVESIYSDYHYGDIDEDERDSKINELEKEYHYNLTINEYEEINQLAWNKWDDDINEHSR